MQVFEYADPATAAAQAALVSPDGGAVGPHMMAWVAPPHFYHTGRILVLYVGNDGPLLTRLRTVLGPPFAGR